MKDNDYGPPPESTLDAKTEGADDETDSVRSDGDGSSKGDPIIGSIRYVSCSVAGSPVIDQSKDNENEGSSSLIMSSFTSTLCVWCMCVCIVF